MLKPRRQSARIHMLEHSVARALAKESAGAGHKQVQRRRRTTPYLSFHGKRVTHPIVDTALIFDLIMRDRANVARNRSREQTRATSPADLLQRRRSTEPVVSRE